MKEFKDYLYNMYLEFIMKQYRALGYDMDVSENIVRKYCIDTDKFYEENGLHIYDYEFIVKNICNFGCDENYMYFRDIGDCTHYLNNNLHKGIWMDISDLGMTVGKFLKEIKNDFIHWYSDNDLIVHHMSYTYMISWNDGTSEEEELRIDSYVAKIAIINDLNSPDGHLELLTVDTLKQLKQGRIWWEY